jgi:uncharacterized protein (TIGR02246 family)
MPEPARRLQIESTFPNHRILRGVPDPRQRAADTFATLRLKTGGAAPTVSTIRFENVQMALRVCLWAHAAVRTAIPNRGVTSMNKENVVSDKLEVHELFARYYTAVDTADADGWLSLWADDGVFDSGKIQAQGKENLRKFIVEHFSMHLETRHYCANVFVDMDGDRAAASSYMLVRSAVDQSAQTATAMCRSKLRKVGNAWKLTEHRYKTDSSFDFAAIGMK